MKYASSFSELEAFARKCIDAHRYPGGDHTFSLSKCQECGLVPFELTIEHHTGSRNNDFKGRILGQCAQCGNAQRIFSYTGSHREPLREEKPRCKCGGTEFFVGECERFERDEGIPGFFDEGVVVGTCARCGQHQALVYTD